MINVEQSLAKLKEICDAKGACLQKLGGKIRVITKHGVFYFSINENIVGVKAKSKVTHEDYWVYIDWVVVE